MNQAEPLYRAIARHLRDAISSGHYPPGSQLPTEQALTEHFGVSRHTAREALQMLRNEGLIARQRGVGTLVVGDEDRRQFSQAIDGIGDLLQYARTARLHVITMGRATRAQAQALSLTDGGWILITGIRGAADRRKPLALTRIYVLESLCPPRSAIEAFNGAINELIAERSGVTAARIEQAICATSLRKRDAVTLDATVGSAALSTVRHYFDRKGAVFQASESLHPGDRFTYRMRLDRT